MKYTAQTVALSTGTFDDVLADELRKARSAAKMTQEQVAARAKISREYVNKLEQGKYTPTVDVLMRVSNAMGTKAWQILKRVEEK